MKTSKILVALCECAVMLALAFALSMAKLWEMPLGGSVTVASMLPIMLIGIKHGNAVGLGTAFLYAGTQALVALAEGNVFPYCESASTLVLCILFDYVVPFTLLGLAGVFRSCKTPRSTELRVYLGMCLVVGLRFACHYLTGVVIWEQWAPDGMGKYLYSLLYNGGYLLPDLAICLVAAALMLRKKELRSLLGISELSQS